MNEQTYNTISILEQPDTTDLVVVLPEKQEEPEQEKEPETNKDNIVQDIIFDLVKSENVSSIQLSKKEIDIINTIISKNPLLLHNINKAIIAIIKDGRIDAIDVPEIIILIKDFYTFCHQEPNIKINIKDLVQIISPIIKYIVHIILHKNKTDTPELLSCCDKLIDACMEVIELQASLKTIGCAFANWFCI